MTFEHDMMWPDVFTGKKTVQQRLADGKTPLQGKLALCADALCAWGNCSMSKAPDQFGDVMVEIGLVLGICTYPPQNLIDLSDRLMVELNYEQAKETTA